MQQDQLIANQPTSGHAVLARWLGALDRMLHREWKWLVFLAWAITAAAYLYTYATSLHYMALGDTDDNMRYLQVRDWLNGQSWWDLSQHRMNPPTGANIHWSRLVDLPIAALMLGLEPLVGATRATQLAVGIAPLLPLLPLMFALAFITRRLSEEEDHGWAIAALLPLCANMALSMYMPLRVDHHGWQLALTAITLAGLVDVKWVRGGLIAGVASALSVAIGMEMMVYLAGAGALIALRWVFKPGAERRMIPYALALSATTALSYAVFASNANRAPVCDALSPVWTTVLVLAGAMLFLLGRARLASWRSRLVAGAVVGGALLLFTYALWPQCLSGAYQISPELERSWLVYIREAKPITVQAQKVWLPMVALPVAGLLSALVACWLVRRDRERLWAWGTVTLMILFSVGLLFWQIRAGPAAQLLAIPPVAWAAWGLLRVIVQGPMPRRVIALVPAALFACMIFIYSLYGPLMATLAAKNNTASAAPVKGKGKPSANARCRTQPALAVLDQLPPAVIFTMVDLGPRIMATTHHSVIAGPYHRNGTAILDIHHAMDGTPERFRQIAAAHGARYLLICPGFPEGTIYQQRSPRGFYAQMIRGQVPAWLSLVHLKTAAELPYSLYRIDYQDLRPAKKARSISAASPSPMPG
ncbi:MAG TPA: hypothetical protein VL918_09835 [Sphingobium sp.]|nr:hypothetical protein [Sphingobium sp.]